MWKVNRVCVEAEEMINNVRSAFKENLRFLEWMDPETRQLAQEKADAISDMIGKIITLKFYTVN